MKKTILKDFSDFNKILDINNNGFFASQRVKHVNPKTGRTYYGSRYILEKSLNNEQLNIFKSNYNNIVFSSCVYRYAKEITHETIIIFDNSLKTIGL